MKNYIFIVPGAGVFSRLLQFAIIPLADIDFDNVFLTLSGITPIDEPPGSFADLAYKICERNVAEMQRAGMEDPYEHIPGFVLVQSKDETYEHKGFLTIGERFDKFNCIEKSPRYKDFKKVLRKLTIQPEIHSAVDQYTSENNIGSDVLGVHVRLTTMNLMHHDLYQQVAIEDYMRIIDRELKARSYRKIFVAADNHESIIKLKQRYGDMILHQDDMIRYPGETFAKFEDSLPEYEWFFMKRFWQESFRECMILSRCGALICRESNFSNMAIVFSDSFEKISRVFRV